MPELALPAYQVPHFSVGAEPISLTPVYGLLQASHLEAQKIS